MKNVELLKAIKETDSHHERMLAVQLKMIASKEQMMTNIDTQPSQNGHCP
jgi:hypothetical protein